MIDREMNRVHARRATSIGFALASASLAIGIAAPGAAAAQDPPVVFRAFRAGTRVSVAVSGDGRTFVAADAGTGFPGAPGGSRALIAWDARTGAELGRVDPGCDTWDLAFLPDGDRVLAAGEDGDLVLREAGAGRVVRRFRGHAGRVMAVDVGRDGRLAVSCGVDGTVRLWDLRTGAQLHRFVDPEPALLLCVRVDADGRRAIVGGHDGVLRVYDLSGRAGPRRLSGHTDQVHALAWLPDGRALSGGRDRTLRSWDVTAGRQLTRTEAGTDVTALAVSPGGRRVIFAGIDGLVHLRDGDIRRDLAVLKGHEGWIWDIKVSADGRFVASGGQDGTVRLWPLGPEDTDPRANRGAGRRAPGRPAGGRPGLR